MLRIDPAQKAKRSDVSPCRLGRADRLSDTKNLRFAAAYIRVSTDDQEELSPESQLEEIRKYARREGIILLEDCIYIEEPMSGRKAKRRQKFQDMVARAKGRPDCPFTVILVWKFSRFCPQPGGEHLLQVHPPLQMRR